MTAPGLPPEMGFARPVPADTNDGYDYRPITEAITDLEDALDGVAFVDEPPDAVLVLMDGHLVLVWQ